MSGGFSQSSAGGNIVSGSLLTSTLNGALETTQLLGIPKASTLSKIWRFNVTGSQSTQVSFLSTPRASLVSAISGSKIFSLRGDPYTAVYYAFSTGSTGESISSVDVTGATQCDTLFPGERFDMQIPIGISSLIVSSSVTSSISLSVSS